MAPSIASLSSADSSGPPSLVDDDFEEDISTIFIDEVLDDISSLSGSAVSEGGDMVGSAGSDMDCDEPPPLVSIAPAESLAPAPAESERTSIAAGRTSVLIIEDSHFDMHWGHTGYMRGGAHLAAIAAWANAMWEELQNDSDRVEHGLIQ